MFAMYGSGESATSRWWEPRRNAHAAPLGTQRRIYGLKYILAVLSIVIQMYNQLHIFEALKHFGKHIVLTSARRNEPQVSFVEARRRRKAGTIMSSWV
ncbi:unnamed protein product [Trichogramma brassicae]|uniref:Uncharacterized protein n=1 Tax=Trichogramma brassicae TaxID=86971 RepID=A0A6H5I6M8_9HYME|nr:unnamed protein product [Trichogramma brassicae]